MRADVAGDALAGDPADAPADLLNGGHERINEKHRPQHRVPVLRADAGVSGYAARIIVSCTCHQPRPQDF